MAVKIRLQRFGTHKAPFYRVVASESNRSRDGKFLEIVGTYDPVKGLVNIDGDKVQKWIGNGAQPTETVRSLLKKYSVLK
ncbi:MAG: 30S ribosomal protein S16 [Tenericutes bacterium GWC2_34_14]|jgi:small subunit ribosomal protein S16|nr:MAG: 30S ribosomal protein S16 [Tenericutes bacterium GWA2_35_7]OHE29725.1 MAG: 30S ribosomal protein S16 [Tenericutes bacterium GWC2_34_14]OHE34704.1 MAG: 30S ribosomal protein S16 [Tenericutes bacterium GWE2_34_108]OHE37435.1 MAG: 30S ribosomal protein S16 [Tenericutes bacterium GWF1_35_14]OHE39430.1 MAG: 30S ribosomal protein S16 [Tenericutes bacterium GWF2_35_184]OHE44380.1 MAG: 30S ribosomal protein S16 [Tenericutes bacterium RIFOXYA2_FULL_36_32]OHE47193.1 MAG: 30S ribosomal protein S